jgi:hypothetical protein
MAPRRTYVISLYDGDESVVVEAVQHDERARLDDLDEVPERIRQWEDEGRGSPGADTGRPGPTSPGDTFGGR